LERISSFGGLDSSGIVDQCHQNTVTPLKTLLHLELQSRAPDEAQRVGCTPRPDRFARRVRPAPALSPAGIVWIEDRPQPCAVCRPLARRPLAEPARTWPAENRRVRWPSPPTPAPNPVASLPGSVQPYGPLPGVNPRHLLFTANDRESTGIARFSPDMRDNQTRCLAVKNEHQSDLSTRGSGNLFVAVSSPAHPTTQPV
jgi:hypothetical protein